MEKIDISKAPPEYRQIQGIVSILPIGYGVSFIICYGAVLYQAFKDRSYGMSMMTICCNFAWELVYAFVHRSKDSTRQIVFVVWALLQAIILYSAIKFSPNEWKHAPLVQQNILLIYTLCFLGFFSWHLALAAYLGPLGGYFWGGYVCQAVMSVGSLSQLITRGSTRGASSTIWLGRFSGSLFTLAISVVHINYWPEVWGWMDNPLMRWLAVAFLLLDVTYGICFRRIYQRERTLEYAKNHERLKHT
ncbi:uncharacterized protein ATNIH1004_001546 [Aspergillus tanneri]|uniref:Uncharacterized protein n=1 Tax=Aspergillus tanneri TaxID=1220188 RepID=A0A5M9MZR7_9EURO|nr:uncharacterized protein ATNIH1004_001546 [Aspergillus tanneri]KAA8652641.1 hypothetical protein ATNIH1004_001546 [Aspergillus tanneri]